MKITDLGKNDENGGDLVITTGSKGYDLNRYSHNGNTYRDEPKAVAKASSGMTNYSDEENQKDMITSGFSSFATDQDKNDDENGFLGAVGNTVKSTVLSALNVGGIVDDVKDINDTIQELVGTKEPEANQFDSANQKILSFKEKKYKQIHMNNYKESLYYNDIVNAANTSSKLQRGDMQDDITHPINSLKSRFGMDGDDWGVDADEIFDLNLANQHTMYTSKPGIKPKFRSAAQEIQNKINKTQNLENDKFAESAKAVRAAVPNVKGETLGEQSITYNGDTFSPVNKSDAQARMINIIKNRNTFLQTIGGIYVKPFLNNDKIENFFIPFEFMPEISEGGVQAKYQAESLLGRIGSMQVYTGTEPSTISMTIKYYALAPDNVNSTKMVAEMSAQDSTTAWQYYWTDSRLREIEYKLRSLVFPIVQSNKNSYLIKPPIVQINLGKSILFASNNEKLKTDTNLFKYPVSSDSSINDYLIATKDNDALKKYIVTSVQIDNPDAAIYTTPTLFSRKDKPTEGQESDGIAGYIETSNGDAGVNRFYRRGFKAVIQLTEVTENFIDIIPDFKAYYDAWNVESQTANKISQTAYTLTASSMSLADQLTATAKELADAAAISQGDAKELIQRAFLLGNEYYTPTSVLATNYLRWQLLTEDGQDSKKLASLIEDINTNYDGGQIVISYGFSDKLYVMRLSVRNAIQTELFYTDSYSPDSLTQTENFDSFSFKKPLDSGFIVYIPINSENANFGLTGYLYVLEKQLETYDTLLKNEANIKKLKISGKNGKVYLTNLQKAKNYLLNGGSFEADKGGTTVTYKVPSISDTISSINSLVNNSISGYTWIINYANILKLTDKVESKVYYGNPSEKNELVKFNLELNFEDYTFTATINNEVRLLENIEAVKAMFDDDDLNLIANTDYSSYFQMDKLKSAYEVLMTPASGYPLYNSFDDFTTWYKDGNGDKNSSVFAESVLNDEKQGLINLMNVPSDVNIDEYKIKVIAAWCRGLNLQSESNAAAKAADQQDEGANNDE